MQDYIDLANKNGIILLDEGKCQFCGANTKRGIHECLEILGIEFPNIDFSNSENHIYRFFIVDAHTLQHPEIHGRWNNHFHLSRLHLIFKFNIKWTYGLSPKLSNYLKKYKIDKQDEYLNPPPISERGTITTTDIIKSLANEKECKELIKKWAAEVYYKWSQYHVIVDNIAQGFFKYK